MKTILDFQRSQQDAITQLTPAVAALADDFGWSLQSIGNDISAKEAKELITFWHPAGCIVNNDDLPARLFTGLPAIFNHRHEEKLEPQQRLMRFDERHIASLAARELISLNLSAYAFVPTATPEAWCRERGEHFAHFVRLHGKTAAVFPTSARSASLFREQKRLTVWLKGLPRPLGVFAANDAVARDVLGACAAGKLDVPQDVAVVGMDNFVNTCEASRPTLTSIGYEPFAYRKMLFETLARLISGDFPAERVLEFNQHTLVRRTSSLRLRQADRAVLAACDLIRQRACKGLRAIDVTALFPCGRRMAEIRFRKAIGHSILSEIRAVRKETAIHLLAGNRVLRDTVAASCGYASWSSVHRLLK